MLGNFRSTRYRVFLLIVIGSAFLIYQSTKIFQLYNSCNNKTNNRKEISDRKTNEQQALNGETNRDQILNALSIIESRDFIRYNCKNMKRIGGLPQYKVNSNDPLWRIDGAWFVCFDDFIKPIENDCYALSFGVNKDDSFDFEISSIVRCNLLSFDPFTEPDRVLEVRRNKPEFSNALEVRVNDKWLFVSSGLVADASKVEKKMMTFDNILDKYKLRNKVIDVFKMDIEGPEFDVIKNFDMGYMCKYIKQIMFESHPPNLDKNRPPELPPFQYFEILAKLEKCFSLFYRHTRFYIYEGPSKTGWASEWQMEGGFKLDIHRFKNEKEIATFMYTYGELYFVNENFLK